MYGEDIDDVCPRHRRCLESLVFPSPPPLKHCLSPEGQWLNENCEMGSEVVSMASNLSRNWLKAASEGGSEEASMASLRPYRWRIGASEGPPEGRENQTFLIRLFRETRDFSIFKTKILAF